MAYRDHKNSLIPPSSVTTGHLFSDARNKASQEWIVLAVASKSVDKRLNYLFFFYAIKAEKWQDQKFWKIMALISFWITPMLPY